MENIKLSDYRLHINPGEEEYVPKSSLEVDVRYFDLDSLIRLYGKEAVVRYLKVRSNIGG